MPQSLSPPPLPVLFRVFADAGDPRKTPAHRAVLHYGATQTDSVRWFICLARARVWQSELSHSVVGYRYDSRYAASFGYLPKVTLWTRAGERRLRTLKWMREAYWDSATGSEPG